jgi:hypothetical protein
VPGPVEILKPSAGETRGRKTSSTISARNSSEVSPRGLPANSVTYLAAATQARQHRVFARSGLRAPADEPVGGRIRRAVEEPAEDLTEHRLLRGGAKKQRG